MSKQIIKKHYFIIATWLICLTYLIFQVTYIQHTAFNVDEFWFAHWTHRYAKGIPYRDFLPYKTVLGYYFLLIPMSLSHAFLTPLYITKYTIATLNAGLFFVTAYWLKKFFSKPAILLSLGLLISSEFVLSYSSQIRVDFFAYWLCLFVALLLLEKRIIWAGILLGLSFLISQKALWYILASNLALFAYCLYSNRSQKTLYSLALFNLSFLITISIYILFWSLFSNFQTVLHSMFYEAYIQFRLDWYEATRKIFWKNTLIQNPLPFLLWPFIWMSLIIIPKNERTFQSFQLRIFILVYATVIMFCLITYKQFFPYNRLAALPVFLLLYTAGFNWILNLLSDKPKNYAFSATAQAVFFIGLIYPLLFFLYSLPEKSGAYQKSMLNITNQLLQDGSDYLAGIELIYDKNQPIAGMRHLDGPALDYLYSPTKKLQPLMLDSLYRTPNITSEQVIAQLKKSHIKFYVNNYRMHALPANIKNYLEKNYTHFWGSIYLYTPLINSEKYKIAKNFLDSAFQTDQWEKMLP